MNKPKCKGITSGDNIFEILARANRSLKEAGKKQEANEMVGKVYESQSYQKAIEIIQEYVEEVN